MAKLVKDMTPEEREKRNARRRVSALTPEDHERTKALARIRASSEEKKEKKRERDRAWREANREKVVERSRAYREANRGRITEQSRAYGKRRSKEKLTIRRLRDRYGLRTSEFDLIRLLQGNLCPICKTPLDRPYVDHDHVTGKIRGLLCNNCNRALGLFKDDPEILMRAIEYIRAGGHPAASVALGKARNRPLAWH